MCQHSKNSARVIFHFTRIYYRPEWKWLPLCVCVCVGDTDFTAEIASLNLPSLLRSICCNDIPSPS